MTTTLDQLMERASLALAQMDYLTCERLCLEALARARQAGDWPYYARILMPLQEARRQRRIIAADGCIRLGTASLGGKPNDWLRDIAAGCLVVTPPHTPAHARTFDDAARLAQQHVEVLYAEPDTADAADDGAWLLRSFRGPAVTCRVPAPPRAWQDAWLAPGERPATTDADADAAAIDPAATPADWFLDAAEMLGDAALTQVDAAATSPGDRLDRLAQMLDVVTDHEILHQRLGDAARAMR